MTLIERIQAPTPNIFKKIRNIGIVLASVSAALLAAPIALPSVIIQVAGYLAVPEVWHQVLVRLRHKKIRQLINSSYGK
jgi:hypothetical protein